MAPDLLTIDAAAAQLTVSAATVRRLGRLHDLRHTVGSLLAESGASLRDIQVWLGHTSPVTSTRYTHVELARLRAVADLVGARNLRAKHRAKGEQQAPVTREMSRETTAK